MGQMKLAWKIASNKSVGWCSVNLGDTEMLLDELTPTGYHFPGSSLQRICFTPAVHRRPAAAAHLDAAWTCTALLLAAADMLGEENVIGFCSNYRCRDFDAASDC